MYNPTSRVLTVLELLQSRPSISGRELASRLEIDVRSVRRYISILQDAGIPIEAMIGRHGGYRLRPGYKLPPLMFSDDEATAIVLGLLGTAWLEVGQSPQAVEGALAKVLRVLPQQARERLGAVASHLVLSPYETQLRPDAALLVELSDAIQQQQCITVLYHSREDRKTRRTVEPYGLAGWWGSWYLVGFCRLRDDYRLFRLDRLQQVQRQRESFVRAADFDCERYVGEQLGNRWPRWQVEVIFEASLDAVQQQVPAAYGLLDETAEGVRFQGQYDDLGVTARYLVSLGLPFVVREPPELRAAVLELAARLTRSAAPPS